MNGMFVRTARRSSLAQIQHVAPVPPGAAPEPVARVYAQVERDFGMLAPPIALHAPAPDALAAAWLMLRETLLITGRADRATKEVVGTAVSLGNTCPYCVEVHSATLGGLIRGGSARGADGDAAALAGGRIASVTDPAVRDAAAWAEACGRRDTAGRHPAPFPADQTAELIGVVVTFQYLNRMVNVFLRDSPFPSSLPGAARGGLMRLLTRILGPTTRNVRPPGTSLGLLPDAPLPADLSWEWDGGHPAGLGRSWVAEAVSRLPAADRPAGRLAMLVAFASYQVGEAVIDEFRQDRPGDTALIELASWASMAAARQVGRWTGQRFPRRNGIFGEARTAVNAAFWD
jgi:alkylhydroperoxidase family enzyme